MNATENTEQGVETLPKHTRSAKRATRWGVVSSAGRDKTIRVTINTVVKHPKYGKYLRRRTNLHAHDEKNECIVGDRVIIMACRPLSKTKNWRLVKILQAAPRQGGPTA
jgi:small subunit ribosomal protein S17